MRLSGTRHSKTPRHRSNRLGVQRLRRRRLTAELLEPRTLLTTYFVDSLSDGPLGAADGKLTLREAVIASRTNRAEGDAVSGTDVDIIRFKPDLFAEARASGVPARITLGSLGTLVLAGDTSIFGPGDELLVIESTLSTANVFAVSASSSAVISGLQVVAGGILNEGNLFLSDSTIQGKTSTNPDRAGITNRGPALDIRGTTIIGHHSSTSGGGLSSVGGTVDIVDSGFVDNSSDLSGGGLFFTSDINASLTNVTISGNTANVDGGGIALESGFLSLYHATIVGNRANADGNATGSGGGFFSSPMTDTTSLTNTIIAGNLQGAVVASTNSDIAGTVDPLRSHANIIGDPNSAGGLIDRSRPGVAFRHGSIIGDGNGGVLPINKILDPTLNSTAGTPVHSLGIDSPAINAGLPGYEPLIAVDGAIVHYRFDEVNDQSGSVQDAGPLGGSISASIIGTPDLTFDGPERSLGSAAFLDGNNDRFETGTVSALDSFSISMWIVPISFGDFGDKWTDGRVIVDGTTDDGSFDFGLSIVDDKLAFGVGPDAFTIFSDTSLLDGFYHHVAATRDGQTGDIKLFVDGRMVASGNGPLGTRTSAKISIGGRHDDTRFYEGGIDEFALFDSVLSESQVSQQRIAAKEPIGDQRGFPSRRSVLEQSSLEFRLATPDIGAFERQSQSVKSSTSVIEVSSFLDEADGDYSPGNLSLREAIEIANFNADRNVITFSKDFAPIPGSFGSSSPVTISLTLGELFIVFDVSIQGPGEDSLRITQDSQSLSTQPFDSPPIFETSPIAMAEISGMTLAGADASAIQNLGIAVLNNLTIRDNTNNSDGGGGILNFGSVTITNSQIVFNKSSLDGGGIRNVSKPGFSPAQLQVGAGTDISFNTATRSGGGVANEAIAFVDRALVQSNTAGIGGGISNRGELASLDVVNSLLKLNSANFRVSGEGVGGGIASFAKLNVFGTTLMFNNATQDTNPTTMVYGAGIYIDLRNRSTRADAIVSSNYFQRNVAATGTGGAGFGGGIAVFSTGVSEVVISNNTFFDNSSGHDGGAVFIGESNLISFDPKSPTLSSNTIVSNRSGTSKVSRGSGVFIDSTTELNYNIISNNVDAFSGNAPSDLAYGDTSFALRLDNIIQNLIGVVDNVANLNDGRFRPNSNGLAANGNKIGLDPLLEPAADNGGPTKTMKLRTGSPAIDSSGSNRLVDQRGFPIIDQVSLPGSSTPSDIGAYELALFSAEPFDSTTASFNSQGVQTGTSVSQFVEGDTQVRYGLGFDDGRPNSEIPKEPGFLGFKFDPAPYTFGGIAEGLFGDRYGGEVTLDFAGRAGIEYGYYIDAGSVSVNYDGLFTFLTDDVNATTFTIDTATSITDGNVFTVSPKVGAYADLVFDLDASITGSGCLIACAGPYTLPINLSKKVPLFSVNRQKTDDAGRAQFLTPNGVLTTDSNNGANTPAFDGAVKFGSGSLTDILESTEEVAEEFVDSLKETREEKRQAEIDKAKAEQDLRRNPGDAAAAAKVTESNQKMAKADGDEKKKTKKKTNSGGGDLCIGQFVTACVGAASDGLLGIEAKLGVGASAGSASVSKQLGSIAVTIPDVQLSDTQLDNSSGKLSATTNDFIPGSIQDKNRQIAKLSVDVAGVLGPLIGIPAGRYEASVGDVLSVSLQTLSYDIQPRLLATQDVSVVPFFNTNSQLRSLAENQRRGVRMDFSTDVMVSVDGTLVTDSDTDPNFVRSVWFSPGSKLTVTKRSAGDVVEVTPNVRLGHKFSNDIGLELDVKGILEALSLKVDIFGQTIVDLGPLIRFEHTLGNFDLGSVFQTKQPLELSTAIDTLNKFTLGTQGDTLRNGATTGGAIVLDVGVNAFGVASTNPVASIETYYTFPSTITNPGGTGPNGEVVQPELRAIESIQFNVTNTFGLKVGVAQRGITLVDGSGPTAIRKVLEPGISFTDIQNPGDWSLEGFDPNFGDGNAFFGLFFGGGGANNAQVRAKGTVSNAVIPNSMPVDAERLRDVNEQTLDDGRVLNLFLRDSVESGSGSFAPLDIDEDGSLSVQRDLVLIQQFLRNRPLTPLLAAPGAGRTTEPLLRAKLQKLSDDRVLDVNSDALVNAADLAILSMFFFGQGNNALDLNSKVPKALATELRGGQATVGIMAQDDQTVVLAADQGLQTIRSANEDFFGIQKSDPASGRVGAFAVDPNAVRGSSPYLPYDVVLNNQTFDSQLDNVGRPVQILDVVVAAPPGMASDNEPMPGAVVIATGAAGTPPRLLSSAMPFAELARTRDQDEIESLAIPGMATRETSRMTRSETLGAAAAPVFVRLPDAGGWDISLPAGVIITDIVFDTNVGGNLYLNHDPRLDSSNIDFDIVLPQTGERFEFSMDSGADGLARLSNNGLGAVNRFLIYPRALPAATLQRIDNLERPEIDLIFGLVLDTSGASTPGAVPTVTAKQLYERQELLRPAPIIAAPGTVGTTFTINRNDLAVDVNGVALSDKPRIGIFVNGATTPTQLVRADGTPIDFATPGSGLVSVDFVGGDANDKLELIGGDLPLFVPLTFDGGLGTDRVSTRAGAPLNLVSQVFLLNVEIIDLKASGVDSLTIDANAIYRNNILVRSIIVDSLSTDLIMMIGNGWRKRDTQEAVSEFSTLFDVWEFNDGLNPHFAGVQLFVNSNIPLPTA